MSTPKNVRGHFASMWISGGDYMVTTTITSEYKSKAREKEQTKRLEIAAELQKLTGQPTKLIAISIDGVNRRWVGVKANGAD